jgi:hypothetical protein
MLNNKALLVNLRISQWTAKKLDKKATLAVQIAHHAGTKAGNFNKSLLPMNERLQRVHDKSQFIRHQWFYPNTLAWSTDGWQLLPTSNYMGTITDWRQHKREWWALAEDFFAHYEDDREIAKRELGDLYDEKDYPSLEQVRAKFMIDLTMMPVPTNDFRVEISEHEHARIQQEVEERVTQAGQQAMMEVWQRLFDKVSHITEKLSDHRAIFRDSMIENARELCELLPRLNFTDDPNLEAMRQEVEAKLARNHPDSLRNDPVLRKEKAEEAKDIMDRMKVFMGGISK